MSVVNDSLSETLKLVKDLEDVENIIKWEGEEFPKRISRRLSASMDLHVRLNERLEDLIVEKRAKLTKKQAKRKEGQDDDGNYWLQNHDIK